MNSALEQLWSVQACYAHSRVSHTLALITPAPRAHWLARKCAKVIGLETCAHVRAEACKSCFVIVPRVCAVRTACTVGIVFIFHAKAVWDR